MSTTDTPLPEKDTTKEAKAKEVDKILKELEEVNKKRMKDDLPPALSVVSLKVSPTRLAQMIVSKFPKVKTFAPTVEELKAWKKNASVAEIAAYNKSGVNRLRIPFAKALEKDVAILLPQYFEDAQKFRENLITLLDKKYPSVKTKVGSIMEELTRLCPIQFSI